MAHKSNDPKPQAIFLQAGGQPIPSGYCGRAATNTSRLSWSTVLRPRATAPARFPDISRCQSTYYIGGWSGRGAEVTRYIVDVTLYIADITRYLASLTLQNASMTCHIIDTTRHIADITLHIARLNVHTTRMTRHIADITLHIIAVKRQSMSMTRHIGLMTLHIIDITRQNLDITLHIAMVNRTGTRTTPMPMARWWTRAVLVGKPAFTAGMSGVGNRLSSLAEGVGQWPAASRINSFISSKGERNNAVSKH